MPRLAIVALFALLLASAASATLPQGARPDPALERRAAALSQQLRCVVCQNQTIADSQADLAVDLRRQVREKLAQGMSDQQVADYLVQRYGEFVLYRPPLKASTFVLWFGPVLLFGGGLIAFAARLRARPSQGPSSDPMAVARAAALLKNQEDAP